MLVIGRKRNESFIIDVPRQARIVVQIVSVESGHIRIGIDAPLDVKVWRSELAEKREQTP